MGTAVCSDLVINEVDYNQPGTDTAEFVEIFNAGNTTATFDNVSLKFINGGMSPAPVYGTIDLTGQTLGPHKYLVVGDPAVTVPAMVAKVDLSSVSMQNGAPDGLALYDGNSHTIIDSLAYQGAITDALIDGNTFNLVHTAATTAADRDLAPNISVIRFPNGAHTGDDSVDWTTTPVVTPGASNLLAEICKQLDRRRWRLARRLRRPRLRRGAQLHRDLQRRHRQQRKHPDRLPRSAMQQPVVRGERQEMLRDVVQLPRWQLRDRVR